MQIYNNVPAEMRGFDQWVCWKHENRGEGKLTKVPYCPFDHRLASTSRPGDWTSFAQALNQVHHFDGIGFVFTDTDPFCFIDFDNPFAVHPNGEPVFPNGQELFEQQQYFENLFDSYSELSPSGQGLHIYCKGSVPTGRNVKPFEVYSSGRFGTVTGNVRRQTGTKYKQTVVDQYFEFIDKRSTLNRSIFEKDFETYSAQSTLTDLDVYNMGVNASNGQKFLDLWNGDIHKYHDGDHSRADFALVDMLGFYTQNREQVARLFRQSALGRRDKAKRQDYVDTMITRSFDKLVPPVDLSEITKQVELVVESVKSKQPGPITIQSEKIFEDKASNAKLLRQSQLDIEADPAYQMPPGITGKIANFLYMQAWKPVPQIATIGALGLMAGLAGRAYNASGSGLNLYLLLLARTGRGKEAISKGYEKIFEEVTKLMPTFGDFEGPSDLASGQALLRYLSDHDTRSFVSVFGEFGPMLKRITSPTAIGADLMTQKVMLDLYSKSGRSGKVSPTAYSDAERNTKTLFSPAFSFVAESAPEWFDERVDLGMISTGLLPRFIISEYRGKRVPSNKNGPLMQPSQDLINDVCAIASCAQQCFAQNVVKEVLYSPEAGILSDKLDKKADDAINNSDNQTVSELWNRVHLNTIRVAGLLAVGNNPFNPVIDVECWQWAERFILHNVNIIESKFEDGLLSSGEHGAESDELEKLERVIGHYLFDDKIKLESYGVPEKMHAAKIVPYVYLNKRCSRVKPFTASRLGSTNALKRAIQSLLDNGDIVEIRKNDAIEAFGHHGKCYGIRSKRLLKRIHSLASDP